MQMVYVNLITMLHPPCLRIWKQLWAFLPTREGSKILLVALRASWMAGELGHRNLSLVDNTREGDGRFCCPKPECDSCSVRNALEGQLDWVWSSQTQSTKTRLAVAAECHNPGEESKKRWGQQRPLGCIRWLHPSQSSHWLTWECRFASNEGKVFIW